MTRKILASALVVISLMSAVGGSALAIFSDTESIQGNTISTGSVDIELTGDFNPITAQNLNPGDWSEWQRVEVDNNSNGPVKLYFYVTDLNGAACGDTMLELATGPLAGDEMAYHFYNSNIGLINGSNNRVEVTGYVFNPSMPAGETAVVHMRAGLGLGASEMNADCDWTGVFVADQAVEETEEPPTSFPVSFPEEMEENV